MEKQYCKIYKLKTEWNGKITGITKTRTKNIQTKKHKDNEQELIQEKTSKVLQALPIR